MKRLIVLLVMVAACGTEDNQRWHPCATDTDCAPGEVCPAETGVCSPTCAAYDDCYQLGFDAVCNAGVCSFNCPGSVDEIESGFKCVPYELGYRVASCP